MYKITEFKVNVGKFRKFLEICGCKGTIWVGSSPTNTTSVVTNLFKGFSVNASKEDGLSVVAIDSSLRKAYVWNKLFDVEVIEEGSLDISDLNPIINILSIFPSQRTIKVSGENNTIFLVSEDDSGEIEYSIKQAANDKNLILSKAKEKVYKEGYSFMEDGRPVLSVGGKDYPFNTSIKLNKSELLRIFKGSVSLIKGDWIQVTLSKEGIQFNFGRANSKGKGKEFIRRTVENPIKTSKRFNLLQTIFGNIIGDATLYFRENTKGKLILWIKSESNGMVQNYNIAQRPDKK